MPSAPRSAPARSPAIRETAVVSRGTLVQTILQLPQGDGQEASVSVPQ